MLTPVEQQEIRTWAKTQKFIYFSFFLALIMYTYVLFVVTKNSSPRELPLASLESFFILISILVAAVKLLVQNRLFSEKKSYATCHSVGQIIQKYTGYHFIMLALSEIPALLGLIITFMTMQLENWWIFFGISAFLLATSIPSRSKLERIAEAHAARRQ